MRERGFLDISGLHVPLSELPPRLELADRPIRERPGIEVNLDVPAMQMTSNELLGERVLDVALNGAPEGPGAVRPVLAGRLDDPVDDLRGQRDLQPTIREIRVQLIDEQGHDPAEV